MNGITLYQINTDFSSRMTSPILAVIHRPDLTPVQIEKKLKRQKKLAALESLLGTSLCGLPFFGVGSAQPWDYVRGLPGTNLLEFTHMIHKQAAEGIRQEMTLRSQAAQQLAKEAKLGPRRNH